MHFICIYLLALLHIFEYTKKTELYPAIGKEELFQMLYSKNKKRGFTLVELIVVLVILAILAALLIPALTGYIDKAKKDQVIAETRMLHEAVQTEMSELYGSSNWKLNFNTTLANSTGTVIGNNPNGYDLKANYNKIKLQNFPKYLVCRKAVPDIFSFLSIARHKSTRLFIIPTAAISVFTLVIPTNIVPIKLAKPPKAVK